MELLDERNLALAFCFSEKELLKQSAVGLLLQYLEMGSDAKLINSVFEKLDKLPDEPADQEFKKLQRFAGKTRRGPLIDIQALNQRYGTLKRRTNVQPNPVNLKKRTQSQSRNLLANHFHT